MMKILKKLMIGLVLAVLALGVIVGVCIILIDVDSDDYKRMISKLVADRTGYTLVLKGAFRYSLYPWLGVEIDGLELGHPGLQQPLLRTGKLRMRVKLLPLLRKKIETDVLYIEDMHVYLVGGQTAKAHQDGGSAKAAQETSDILLPIGALAFGGVDVRDATIHSLDQQGNAQWVLSELNLKTDALQMEVPIQLAATMKLAINGSQTESAIALKGTIQYTDHGRRLTIQPFTVEAMLENRLIPKGQRQLSLRTGLEMDFGLGQLHLHDIGLQGLGSTVSGTLQWDDLHTPTPSPTGQLTVQGEDIGLFFKLAGMGSLASGLAGSSDRDFSLKLGLRSVMPNGDIDIAPFSMDALGTSVEATIQARNGFSDDRLIQGDLRVNGSNLPLLIKLFTAFQDPGGGFSAYADALSRSREKAFQLETKFDLDMQAGRLDLPMLEARALGVALSASLSGDDAIQGDVKLVADPLRPLLDAVSQRGLAKIVEALTVEAKILGDWQQLRIQPLVLTTHLRQPPHRAPAHLTMQADTLLDIQGQTLELAGLILSGLGLDIQGEMKLSGGLDSPALNGMLSVAAFNPRKLMARLNRPMAFAADSLTHFSLQQARFSGTPQRLELELVQGRLDDTHFQGDLVVRDDVTPRSYQFGMHFDQLDLDRYSPVAQSGKKGSEDVPVARADADGQIPLDRLNDLDVKGDIQFDTLRAFGLHLQQLRLSTHVKEGTLKLVPITAQLYEGSYSGAVEIATRHPQPKWTLESNMTNIDIAALLMDLTREASLKTTGNLSLLLRAAGDRVDQLRHSLAGSGEIALQAGVLEGLDVARIMQQLDLLVRLKKIDLVDKGEATHFDSLAASLRVDKGVVHNDDLLLMSKGFQIKGQGVLLDLKDTSWDYQFIIHTDKTEQVIDGKHYDIKGRELPISCRGPLADKRCTLGVGHILRSKIGGALSDFLGSGADEAGQTDQTESNEPSSIKDLLTPLKENLKDKLLDKLF